MKRMGLFLYMLMCMNIGKSYEKTLMEITEQKSKSAYQGALSSNGMSKNY